MTIYRIVIVEDEPITRKVLSSLVSSHDSFELIGAHASLAEARAGLQGYDAMPDVMLVDLSLPDGCGTALIREVRALKPAPECMVMTTHDDAQHLLQALESGAKGYLLKGDLSDDIGGSILELLSGGSPISPQMARLLLQRFDKTAEDAQAEHDLTQREIEVLQALAEGKQRKQIARDLDISVNTISAHIKRIYEKLEVSSSVQAIQRAHRLNILDE